MAQNLAFRGRLFTAWYLYQARPGIGELTQDWLAEEVGRRIGEEIDSSAVSKWLRKGQVPKLPTIQALAEALEVDPGWLAFGPASKAPAPRDAAFDLAQPREQPDGD